MLTILKESKLDKLNDSVFSICGISTKDIDGAVEFSILMPPKYLLDKLEEKDIKKGKFEKKYLDYLKKSDTNVEWSIYSIGVSLSNGTPVALVCTDDEWDLGYIQILGEYISDAFDVELTPIKEVDEEVEAVLSDEGIKKKKFKKIGTDDLDEKKEAKMIKKIKKNFAETFEPNDYFETLSKKFAVDSMILSLAEGDDPVITFDKKYAIKGIDANKYGGKKSILIEAIMAPKEVGSETKVDKLIKRVLEGHDLTYKEKSLNKLSKGDLIALMCEIYTKLGEYRLEKNEAEE